MYISQNATPDIQAQVNAAEAQGIPVTTITEAHTTMATDPSTVLHGIPDGLIEIQ